MARSASIPAIVALVIATALMTCACALWGQSIPGPGDRPIASGAVLTLRSLAVALGAAGQCVALGFALPTLVGPRRFYSHAAFALAVVASFACVLAVVIHLTQ